MSPFSLCNITDITNTTFFFILSLLQNQLKPNLHQSKLGWRGFKFVQIKYLVFSRGDNNEIAKRHFTLFKNILPPEPLGRIQTNCRRYIAKILPIRRKTLSNQPNHHKAP